MKTKLKLEQGQIWKQGDSYFRIVKWARLTIEYKVMKDLSSKEGTLHAVSKKEFCRLIKGATLLTPGMIAANEAAHAEAAAATAASGSIHPSEAESVEEPPPTVL